MKPIRHFRTFGEIKIQKCLIIKFHTIEREIGCFSASLHNPMHFFPLSRHKSHPSVSPSQARQMTIVHTNYSEPIMIGWVRIPAIFRNRNI